VNTEGIGLLIGVTISIAVLVFAICYANWKLKP
jgi:hypothetical protein